MPNARFEMARELFQNAYQLQMQGDFDLAAQFYKRSIELHPTAEAHTFLGWTYHFQGKIDEAIAECKQAIVVDPTFGNPYNDIGAYLIDKGELDEAIPWLEKAKQAPRYDPRHFPFINLCRIYLTKGMIQKALEEFGGALALNPGDQELTQLVEELQTKLQ